MGQHGFGVAALLALVGCNGPAPSEEENVAAATPTGAPAAPAMPAPAAARYARDGAIGLVPPATMREATAFAGFLDPRSTASIVLTEMPPQVFAPTAARLDAGRTMDPALRLDGGGERVLLRDGTPARLYRATQTIATGTFAKWLLLANGQRLTAMVAAQVSAADAASVGPALEAALRSVTLRVPRAASGGLGNLPFAIGDTAGFRLVRTLGGSSAQFTDGAKDVDPAGTQPMVIVASSLRPMPGDHAAAARATFASLPPLSEVRIAAEGATDAGTGYRIAATAARRGRPIGIVQHMRFDPSGGYVRTLCVTSAARDITARCDRLAATVRPRP